MKKYISSTESNLDIVTRLFVSCGQFNLKSIKILQFFNNIEFYNLSFLNKTLNHTVKYILENDELGFEWQKSLKHIDRLGLISNICNYDNKEMSYVITRLYQQDVNPYDFVPFVNNNLFLKFHKFTEYETRENFIEKIFNIFLLSESSSIQTLGLYILSSIKLQLDELNTKQIDLLKIIDNEKIFTLDCNILEIIVFDNPKWTELGLETLYVDIASENPIFADQIINDPEEIKYINIYDICFIASKHHSFADKFLDMPNLISQLDELSEILILAEESIDCAKKLAKIFDQILPEILSMNAYFEFCSYIYNLDYIDEAVVKLFQYLIDVELIKSDSPLCKAIISHDKKNGDECEYDDEIMINLNDLDSDNIVNNEIAKNFIFTIGDNLSDGHDILINN